MANYKKKTEKVEENPIEEKQEVKVETQKVKMPKKKQLPTTQYTIKSRVKVRGVWKEKNDTIKLTKEGAEFFRSKNYI